MGLRTSRLEPRSRICTKCALRWPRQRTCDRCGSRLLKPKKALPQLVRPTPLADSLRRRANAILIVGVVLTALLFLVCFILFSMAADHYESRSHWLVQIVAKLVALLLTLVVPAAALFFGSEIYFRLAKRTAPVRIDVASSEAPPIDEVTVTGVVAAGDAALLTSPVTERACVAYRVIGDVGDARIDDGDAVSFFIDEVRVDAVVMRAEMGDRVEVARRGEAQQFLEEVGLASLEGRLRLAETSVCVGDEITVSGLPEHAVVREGYRDGVQKVVALTDAVITMSSESGEYDLT